MGRLGRDETSSGLESERDPDTGKKKAYFFCALISATVGL